MPHVSTLKIGSLIVFMANGRSGTPQPLVSMTAPQQCGDGSGLFSYIHVANTRDGLLKSVRSWTGFSVTDRDYDRFWRIEGEISAEELAKFPSVFPKDYSGL